MAEAGLAALVMGALVVPHTLPLHRVNPATASAVWLAALALRALIALAVALAALLVLPTTPLFAAVSGWSAHGLIGTLHVDLSGDPVAHLAALGPPLVLALLAIGFLASLARGAFLLRRLLARRLLGQGPGGSIVIASSEMLVAVPSLGPGRILLSHRALAELDAAELEACLAHETGHLRRGHRFIGLTGRCLAALGRTVPGSAAARRGLMLSLERDADEYAVARTGKPLALASAVCKVAAASTPAGRTGAPVMSAAGAGAPWPRLDGLLEGGRRRASRRVERLVLAMAFLLAAVITGATAALVLWLAQVAEPGALAAAISCHA
jgi:Zn-dependent protease with chaperone function